MSQLGYTDGDICGRDSCFGVIKLHKVVNCSCHINPPCYSCTSATHFCPACGWEESDDPLCVREASKYYIGGPTPFVERKSRVLDPTKIDYIIEMHSNASQKCIGVYPEGTTRAEVEARCKGSWGGRFESFGNGRFVYIAQTD